MDPLSVTASVIAVLQATEAVVSICCDYRSAVKGAPWDISQILDQIRSLRGVLRDLESLADRAETKSSTADIHLLALKRMCDPGNGETEKIVQRLERYKSTLSLAVAADQTSIILNIHAATQNAAITVLRQEIHRWLDAPDPSPKHNQSLSKRQLGTGAWFTNGQKFATWLDNPHSMIWLYGIPGCGKTILCSTIIEHTIRHVSKLPKSTAVAYYYFAFDDPKSQSADMMIRSLVTQLAAQCSGPVPSLESLFSTCAEGQRKPSHDQTMSIARELLESFDSVFIICDALDECADRHVLLADIENLTKSSLPRLHFLATSRQEKDIEDALGSIIGPEEKIGIQSSVINDDLKAYVVNRIQTDVNLKRWRSPDLQQLITTALVRKADGMFQWVACQLDTIMHCLSRAALHEALENLPKGLDDTYVRMLAKIDSIGQHGAVHRILQFLVFCSEIWTMSEVAEMVALGPTNKPFLDLQRRLIDEEDVLSICSGLVIEQRNADFPDAWRALGLAHFSIQEFLLSRRILDGPAHKWFINRNAANEFLTEAYLAYILHFNNIHSEEESEYMVRREYPLAHKAAQSVLGYARLLEENKPREPSEALELFVAGTNAFLLWLKLNYEDDGIHHDTRVLQDGTGLWPGALQMAAKYGLCSTVKQMLDLSADINARSMLGVKYIADINSPPDLGATALIQASYWRRPRVVEVLLDNGASVHVAGGGHVNALSAAVLGPFDGYDYGDLEVVQMLLRHGADVNVKWTRRRFLNTTILQEALALYGASESEQKILELLLDYGATVNAASSHGCLLEVTASKGQFDVCLKLVKSGHSLGNSLGLNTLVLASMNQDSKELMAALIDYGTDVNGRCSEDPHLNLIRQWTPLEAACEAGAWHSVALLLDRSADPNSCSHLHNALECALNSYPEYDDGYDDTSTLELLLSKDASLTQVRPSMLHNDGRQKFNGLRTAPDFKTFLRNYRGVRSHQPKPRSRWDRRETSGEIPILLG